MNITELSVRRPVMMSMIYLLILIISMVFLTNLDIALYPSVDMPVISIIVSCTDAGPEEIESQVTKPLEDALSSVENLNTMTSLSENERVMIILEFNYGTDLDEAEDDIEAILSMQTRLLPDWVESTNVMQMNSLSSSTIVTLILRGNDSLANLQSIAEEDIQPLLERIPGVSEVDVFGGKESSYVIEVDQARMESYGLTLSEISSTISGGNRMISMGEITSEGKDYQLHADSRYKSIEEIEDTVIAVKDGYPVRVSDVATVGYDEDSGRRKSYVNGEEVVTMSISNTSDSSQMQVANQIIALLPELQDALPEGITLELKQDSTELIRSTMNEVYASAIEGVILAALVIFLFLRGIKTTIIICLSMPISIFITLMGMSLFDISINAMSMSGLILGIGMIVDASIVILENIYAIRLTGEKSVASAILGSKNMINAIVASTLTTLCVFFPLIIYRYDIGMFGVMFQDLIVTVCISLLSSLFVAVTLVPALSGSILRINTRTQKPLRNRMLKNIDLFMLKLEDRMREKYVSSLDYFLSHRLLLILLLVLLLIFSMSFIGDIGINLMPQSNTDDSVTMDLELEAGTSNSVTEACLFDMYSRILETLPEESYESITIEVGSSNTGTITVQLPDITEQKYSAKEVENLLRPLTQENAGESWLFSSGRGPVSSKPIKVKVLSTDIDASKDVIGEIESLLSSIDGIMDIDSNLSDGEPRIEISIDSSLAEEFGVSLSDVSTLIYQSVNGMTATTLSAIDSENSYDLGIRLRDEDVDSFEKLGSLLITTAQGEKVRLDSFVDFSYGENPSSIRREDKMRVNYVEADVAEGYDSSVIQKEVDRILEENLVLPEGVELEMDGDMATMTGYAPTLVMIVILALLLVYAVMAAQFESLTDPFIIFLTIPMVLIGVIWIHILTSNALSLFSIVGIVALIGVAVNNGIVLVDCINRLLKEGLDMRQACLEAARGRLRPILMTTLTTILGMIPLAFFPGDGAEMMQPIALTFVGGLLTGAFLTLYLSPVLYTIINRNKEKRIRHPESLENQLREFDMRRLKDLDSQL